MSLNRKLLIDKPMENNTDGPDVRGFWRSLRSKLFWRHEYILINRFTLEWNLLCKELIYICVLYLNWIDSFLEFLFINQNVINIDATMHNINLCVYYMNCLEKLLNKLNRNMWWINNFMDRYKLWSVVINKVQRLGRLYCVNQIYKIIKRPAI